MWKSKTTLYTTPAFVYKEPSLKAYQSTTPNVIESISTAPLAGKFLTRIKFTPVTDFIYKDLIVNTSTEAVYSVLDVQYPRIPVLSSNLENTFTYEDSFYQTATPETLYVNAEDGDIWIDLAYEVSNITTLGNISIFTSPSALARIYLQSNVSSARQLINLGFLQQTTVSPETVLTFVYSYKVYDAATKQSFSVLNNFTEVKRIPVMVHGHSYENFDDIELFLANGRQYRKMHSLETVDALFSSQPYPGFIINQDYITLLNN